VSTTRPYPPSWIVSRGRSKVLLDIVHQTGAQQADTYQIDPREIDAQEITLRIAQLSSLKTKFEVLPKEHQACIQQNKVIRSLYFPVIRRRWSQIPHADEASNAWVFDDTLTPFNDWLGSKKDSDGLFCITGRVGLIKLPRTMMNIC
jgi:hypothetical protein